MMHEKNYIVPASIIEELRRGYHGIVTEHHVSNDICALFKTRDLILIKKTDPDKGKKKKVVSWRKKSSEEINDILINQEWRAYL